MASSEAIQQEVGPVPIWFSAMGNQPIQHSIQRSTPLQLHNQGRRHGWAPLQIAKLVNC